MTNPEPADAETPTFTDVQSLPSLGMLQKLRLSFFAIIPRHWRKLRARHVVIYVCTVLIVAEGPGMYVYRYSLSVNEVIAASIVTLLCGLVIIFTILDELDRNDPTNALLKTDVDDD